jgi:hypothetical protein
VREISCDSKGVDDIVESKLIDKRARLKEERERLRFGNLSGSLVSVAIGGRHTWPIPPEAPRTTIKNSATIGDVWRSQLFTYLL